MSINLDCFENVIGITETECECYGDIESQESLSGLYLDQLVELADVFQLVDCQNGSDVSEVISNSIEQAKQEFLADFNANILNRFKIRRNPFSGVIGKPTFKRTMSLTDGKIAGVRIYCDNIKSGVLKINKLGGVFSKNGTLDITIVNSIDEEVGVYTINTVANRYALTTVDIELPLYSDMQERLEYYMYYDVDVTNQPKDNEIKCGTCGSFKPRFNTVRPYFYQHVGSQYNWANWIMVGGLHMTKPESWMELCNTITTSSNLMYGLMFQIELTCSPNTIICKDNMYYDKDPVSHAVAHAIRYKAGSIIIDKILRSGMINRLTLLNREEKQANLDDMMGRYWNLITYIVDNVSITENDCYACKPKYPISVGGIRA